MAYEEILYEEDGPIGTITLNRPDDGNMFTERMCHEIRDCINEIRRETRTRVIVLTGAGDKFFAQAVGRTGCRTPRSTRAYYRHSKCTRASIVCKSR